MKNTAPLALLLGGLCFANLCPAEESTKAGTEIQRSIHPDNKSSAEAAPIEAHPGGYKLSALLLNFFSIENQPKADGTSTGRATAMEFPLLRGEGTGAGKDFEFDIPLFRLTRVDFESVHAKDSGEDSLRGFRFLEFPFTQFIDWKGDGREKSETRLVNSPLFTLSERTRDGEARTEEYLDVPLLTAYRTESAPDKGAARVGTLDFFGDPLLGLYHSEREGDSRTQKVADSPLLTLWQNSGDSTGSAWELFQAPLVSVAEYKGDEEQKCFEILDLTVTTLFETKKDADISETTLLSLPFESGLFRYKKDSNGDTDVAVAKLPVLGSLYRSKPDGDGHSTKLLYLFTFHTGPR